MFPHFHKIFAIFRKREETPVIDLYAAGTSNGMRAKIMLEECGVPYTLHPIDLMKGDQKKPEFLARNPWGQIPVIVDSEGPGGKPMTLSQSVGIMLYLAEKTGKFIPQDSAKRAAFWQALMNAASDMGPTLGSIFTIVRSKEPHKPSQQIFEDRWKGYMQSPISRSSAWSAAPRPPCRRWS
jgi:GSH-dependent disulfide-bond oxidoreductase